MSLKAKDIWGLTRTEAQRKLKELEASLLETEPHSMQISSIRKSIARIKTYLRQLELGIAKEGTGSLKPVHKKEERKKENNKTDKKDVKKEEKNVGKKEVSKKND